MKILVTGSGMSGSWKIRGEQLGAAIGATVLPNATDLRGFDVAVVVKRPPAGLVERIHRAGVRLVWDVVDAWPQPGGNEWSREACLAWLRVLIKTMRPAAIVAASPRMLADCREEFPNIPGAFVRHHARPGMQRNPIREHLQRVGYEGGNYLGRWRDNLEAECAKRGWSFVVNPPEGLASLDVVVAMREACGYAARNWKSNVKLANAQGSGTPIVCGSENGYAVPTPKGVHFADDARELSDAFELLTEHACRRRVADLLYEARPTLENVAQRYLMWLHEICQ